MQKKIYFWPSLDCGLYAPGHAVAVAESFGQAVDMLERDYPDTPKNLLLSSECQELAIEDRFTLLDQGWD